MQRFRGNLKLFEVVSINHIKVTRVKIENWFENTFRFSNKHRSGFSPRLHIEIEIDFRITTSEFKIRLTRLFSQTYIDVVPGSVN